MTRLPSGSRDIIGLPGPDYKVGPYCSVPGCQKVADHGHHIVRRSFIPGDFQDWVLMPDGVEIANKTGLCFTHHDLITVNKAAIDYEDGVFLWCYEGQEAPLTKQPLLLHELVEIHEGHGLSEEEAHTRPICPGCGRAMPKPKIETPPEEKKERGTWAISIPMDERENGFEVLNELLGAAREELDKAGISYGKGNRVKYYQLATALALFVQHADQVLSDS